MYYNLVALVCIAFQYYANEIKLLKQCNVDTWLFITLYHIVSPLLEQINYNGERLEEILSC
jgi:hypothetical protein